MYTLIGKSQLFVSHACLPMLPGDIYVCMYVCILATLPRGWEPHEIVKFIILLNKHVIIHTPEKKKRYRHTA